MLKFCLMSCLVIILQSKTVGLQLRHQITVLFPLHLKQTASRFGFSTTAKISDLLFSEIKHHPANAFLTERGQFSTLVVGKKSSPDYQS